MKKSKTFKTLNSFMKEQDNLLASTVKVQHRSTKSALKFAAYQKNKIQQHEEFKKRDNNFYTKLQHKLNEQLKFLNNHFTPEVREKMILKERCRTYKHMRINYRNAHKGVNGESKKSRHIATADPKNKENRKIQYIRPYTSDIKLKRKGKNIAIVNQLSGIMDECWKEKNNFRQIKEDFEVVSFYTKLVQRNSEKILKKLF